MIRRKTGLGILVLAALTAAGFWANRGQKEAGPPPIAGLDTSLDYALQTFELRMFDRDGTPSVHLLAPGMRNDAGTGVSTVETPSIELVHENALWRIEADSAIVGADRERILMSGDVRMRRSGIEPAVEVTTSEMTLEVTPRTASSDRPVRVVEGPNLMEAIGFRVDIVDNTFQLLNQVKLTYEVN